MVFALAVFLAGLAVFALDWIHRTPAALLGALLLVVAGAIGQEEAVEAVNWETLGLLVGMMILIGILEEDPFPFLIVEVLASNIGGTATLIGDPPNIIIGTEVDELSFMDFIVNLTPPIVVILLVSLGIVWLVHARKLC